MKIYPRPRRSPPGNVLDSEPRLRLRHLLGLI
jgi:hypothetical protein